VQPKFDPPPPGPRSGGFRAWFSHNWGFIAATALGAVVGGLIGVAAAGTDTTTTRTMTRALTETQTATTTVAEVRTETETETETATVEQPSSEPGESDQSFSGSGTETIGTLEIPVDSTLEWTNDGALFQIFDASFGITVSSLAPSGSTSVSAGVYPNVLVNAVGSWTITISPT
jgi:hypothetical protein